MQTCPYCQSTVRQVKLGRNPSWSQRYRCRACGRKYTPEPTPQGYDAPTRQRALRLYADGMNLRRIGRTLGVVHPSSSSMPGIAAGMIQRGRGSIITMAASAARLPVGASAAYAAAKAGVIMLSRHLSNEDAVTASDVMVLPMDQAFEA